MRCAATNSAIGIKILTKFKKRAILHEPNCSANDGPTGGPSSCFSRCPNVWVLQWFFENGKCPTLRESTVNRCRHSFPVRLWQTLGALRSQGMWKHVLKPRSATAKHDIIGRIKIIRRRNKNGFTVFTVFTRTVYSEIF